MIFTNTEIDGAMIIDIDRLSDSRGFFARSFCRREFEEHNLDPEVVQCNISFNEAKGTLRGLHSQAVGCEEAKLVRCSHGSIHDLILDLRPDSPSYLKHLGILLSEENRRMLFVPKGVFHGFLTLEDNTEVCYQMSEYFVPGKALGVRWNDPAFGIDWPEDVQVINDKDASYPDYNHRK